MNRPALSLSGSSLVRAACAAALLAGAARLDAAQTPPGHAPGAPAGSYPVSDLEQINLFNGNMQLRLRLLDVDGRGESGTTVNLPIEWHWRVETGDGQFWIPAFNYWRTSKPGYGPGEMSYSRDGVSGSPGQLLTRLTFTSGDGTEYELRDGATDGAPQNSLPTFANRGRVWRTQDGTAATYYSDADIFDGGELVLNGFFLLRDGTRYRIDGGYVTWTRDRNGNRTDFTYVDLPDFHGVRRGRKVATITDSLNRLVTFDYADGIEPFDTITFKGSGGEERTIVVVYSFLHDALAPGESISRYGQSGACPSGGLFPSFPWAFPCDQHDPIVVHNVQIPDGRHYQFRYNRYAELARVELPTGGAIQYQFATFPSPGAGTIYRRLTERRVFADLANPTGPTQVTVYLPPLTSTDPMPPGEAQRVDVNDLDPATGQVKRRTSHHFHGSASSGLVVEPTEYPHWRIGREYRTEVYEGTATSPLRTVQHVWGQAPPFPPNGKPYNPRIVQTTTTLDDGQAAQRQFSHDVYNNVIAVEESDYGLFLVRRSETQFVTTLAGVDYAGALTQTANLDVHLRNLPQLERKYSWTGSGWAQRSQTQYEYDNYTPDTNHAALVPYAANSVTGTFSTFLDGSWTRRGNATGVFRTIDAGGSTTVNTYAQYNVLGSVVKVIDARGKSTTFQFEDRFGVPDGVVTGNAPPTEVGSLQTLAFNSTASNLLGHQTQRQFDYYLGAVVDEQDPNGTVTTSFHDDALDRPTRVVMANNSAVERSRMDFEYLDFNGDDIEVNTVVTRKDRTTFGDGFERAEADFDGIGREIRTRIYEDAAVYPEGNITWVEKVYDGLGRLAQVSNPRRNGSPEWTTTTFDALDRLVRVQTPDGAASTSTFTGATTTTQDSAGKKRDQRQDALGRVARVVEDPGTPPANANYVTTYAYNVFDQLTVVAQGESATPCPAVVAGRQCRMFDYDWLGRLKAVTTPEVAPAALGPAPNVVASARYFYDGNGNLTQKRDPRVTVDYTYDDLSRPLTRTYPGGTSPSVSFAYDSSSVPNANATGRMTQVSNSVSTSDYLSYDRLGRIKQSRQTTGGIAYGFTYGYDLGGNRTSMTYPSGRTVTTGWDRVSRVASVQQTAPTLAPFASSAEYAPHGAMRRLLLGNGLWESTTLFNSRLQPRFMGLGTTQTNLSLLSLEYGYGGTNNNGNVLSQQIQFGGTPITQTYMYDGVNRLQSATEAGVWSQAYTYNRFGNRWVPGGSYIPNPPLTPTAEGSFDNQTNRLASPNLYDNSGNHTKDLLNRTFGYNGDNLQATYDLGGGTPTVNYAYDGEGRRISRTQAGASRVFVYDAFGKLAAEYTSGALNEGVGVAYMTADSLGSVRLVTNRASAVLARHDFLPFGEELPSTGAGGVRPSSAGYGGVDGVRHRFTGKERDNENGLDYFGARYFSALRGDSRASTRLRGIRSILAAGIGTRTRSAIRLLSSTPRAGWVSPSTRSL